MNALNVMTTTNTKPRVKRGVDFVEIDWDADTCVSLEDLAGSKLAGKPVTRIERRGGKLKLFFGDGDISRSAS